MRRLFVDPISVLPFLLIITPVWLVELLKSQDANPHSNILVYLIVITVSLIFIPGFNYIEYDSETFKNISMSGIKTFKIDNIIQIKFSSANKIAESKGEFYSILFIERNGKEHVVRTKAYKKKDLKKIFDYFNKTSSVI